jgi:hypothetical protein
MYTVTYKQLGSLFKHTLTRVKGDGITESGDVRFFILEDESRVEVPVLDVVFTFSKERFDLIKKNMEIEAGRTIPTL